jgi:hypothetical protein
MNATDETHHEQPTRRASGVIVGVVADGPGRRRDPRAERRAARTTSSGRTGTVAGGDWSDFRSDRRAELIDAPAPGLRKPGGAPMTWSAGVPGATRRRCPTRARGPRPMAAKRRCRAYRTSATKWRVRRKRRRK